MPPEMEPELEAVVRILAQNRWPWRLHATYDETISRALDVFEHVNRDIAARGSALVLRSRRDDLGPVTSIESRRWAAASPCSIAWRIKASTSLIATVLVRPKRPRPSRACCRKASRSPPAPTRRASPPTIRGSRSRGSSPDARSADCASTRNAIASTARRRCVCGPEHVTWFSNEEGKKGRIEVGQLADLIVPDRDYFACAESEIADTISELTIVGGRIVYAAGRFASLDESPPPPAMPDWSPVRRFGGYAGWGDQLRGQTDVQQRFCGVHGHDHGRVWAGDAPVDDFKSFWGTLGCSCFAF